MHLMEVLICQVNKLSYYTCKRSNNFPIKRKLFYSLIVHTFMLLLISKMQLMENTTNSTTVLCMYIYTPNNLLLILLTQYTDLPKDIAYLTTCLSYILHNDVFVALQLVFITHLIKSRDTRKNRINKLLHRISLKTLQIHANKDMSICGINIT